MNDVKLFPFQQDFDSYNQKENKIFDEHHHLQRKQTISPTIGKKYIDMRKYHVKVTYNSMGEMVREKIDLNTQRSLKRRLKHASNDDDIHCKRNYIDKQKFVVKRRKSSYSLSDLRRTIHVLREVLLGKLSRDIMYSRSLNECPLPEVLRFYCETSFGATSIAECRQTDLFNATLGLQRTSPFLRTMKRLLNIPGIEPYPDNISNIYFELWIWFMTNDVIVDFECQFHGDGLISIDIDARLKRLLVTADSFFASLRWIIEEYSHSFPQDFILNLEQRIFCIEAYKLSCGKQRQNDWFDIDEILELTMDYLEELDKESEKVDIELFGPSVKRYKVIAPSNIKVEGQATKCNWSFFDSLKAIKTLLDQYIVEDENRLGYIGYAPFRHILQTWFMMRRQESQIGHDQTKQLIDLFQSDNSAEKANYIHLVGIIYTILMDEQTLPTATDIIHYFSHSSRGIELHHLNLLKVYVAKIRLHKIRQKNQRRSEFNTADESRRTMVKSKMISHDAASDFLAKWLTNGSTRNDFRNNIKESLLVVNEMNKRSIMNKEKEVRPKTPLHIVEPEGNFEPDLSESFEALYEDSMGCEDKDIDIGLTSAHQNCHPEIKPGLPNQLFQDSIIKAPFFRFSFGEIERNSNMLPLLIDSRPDSRRDQLGVTPLSHLMEKVMKDEFTSKAPNEKIAVGIYDLKSQHENLLQITVKCEGSSEGSSKCNSEDSSEGKPVRSSRGKLTQTLLENAIERPQTIENTLVKLDNNMSTTTTDNQSNSNGALHKSKTESIEKVDIEVVEASMGNHHMEASRAQDQSILLPFLKPPCHSTKNSDCMRNKIPDNLKLEKNDLNVNNDLPVIRRIESTITSSSQMSYDVLSQSFHNEYKLHLYRFVFRTLNEISRNLLQSEKLVSQAFWTKATLVNMFMKFLSLHQTIDHGIRKRLSRFYSSKATSKDLYKTPILLEGCNFNTHISSRGDRFIRMKSRNRFNLRQWSHHLSKQDNSLTTMNGRQNKICPPSTNEISKTDPNEIQISQMCIGNLDIDDFSIIEVHDKSHQLELINLLLVDKLRWEPLFEENENILLKIICKFHTHHGDLHRARCRHRLDKEELRCVAEYLSSIQRIARNRQIKTILHSSSIFEKNDQPDRICVGVKSLLLTAKRRKKNRTRKVNDQSTRSTLFNSFAYEQKIQIIHYKLPK